MNPLGFNDLNVNQAIKDYFDERERFLLGDADMMDWDIIGIADDENRHMQYYAAAGITPTEITYTILEMDCYDTQAIVIVEEYITYVQTEALNTECVLHELRLYLNGNNMPVVAADSYTEQCSSFTSCSYAAPLAQTYTATSSAGSSLCILEIAKGELGYAETGSNMTKYGEWYGSNGVAWCAIFVSWCADQADISTSIIPKNSVSNTIRLHFVNLDRYYESANYGGSYTPQAGDLIFIGDTPDSSTHIGIVEKVENDYVYIYDGNWSNKVSYHSYRLTATDIIGYGNPAYACTNHPFVYGSDAVGHSPSCDICGYVADTEDHTFVYEGNASNHSQVCSVCDYTTQAEEHTFIFESDASNHSQVCDVCNYTAYTEEHTFASAYAKNNASHWHECTICGYAGGLASHTSSAGYITTSTNHWKVCDICNGVYGKGQHKMIMGPDGTYQCITCNYTSGSSMIVSVTEPVNDA